MNQVAATVYVRFPSSAERVVYGVFTRDYRFNVLNCRVSKRDKQHSRKEGISTLLSKQNTHGR